MINKRHILTIVALLMALPCAWSQSSTSHEAVVAGGGNAVGSGLRYSYSIGQAFASHGSNGFSLEEGIQQGFCIPTLETVQWEVCQKNMAQLLALLPSGVTVPQTVDVMTAGNYDFEMYLVGEGGCDSIVYVELTVYPIYDTVDTAQASESYTWEGTTYQVSGDYTKTLTSVHGCDSIVKMHLSILNNAPVPVIYVVLNRALAVDHNAEGYNEALYKAYRWYRDGELVGEGSDSYQSPQGELHGCYWLEVATDDALQYWVRSNTECVGVTGINDVLADMKLKIAPNPARTGATVRLNIDTEASLQGCKMMIYDAQGRLIIDQDAQNQMQFAAPSTAGLYSVHVILPNGNRASRHMVVR